ncbi:coiled-coil domain-containing protein [Tessaracoccus caeni]|uniref:hypothetical protein n=1 Tax=Tessaracoccus caeni TaxID=3031239 RepID=UPI0023DB76AE|nr:hypothetical protein [Tessaracoccus caeni]MDF1488915.1 hypothetical protein [Tessaracoccus caeni]
MTQATFRTVLRGYEPAQVDAEISALAKALEGARTEVGRLTAQLNETRQGQSALERRVVAAEARVADAVRASETVAVPTYAGLGERIGRILTLADEEADELRRSAHEEAQALVALATDRADQTAAQANRYAVETRTAVDAQAEEILTSAQRQAQETVELADREAAARRAEGEAIYEAQRAAAAEAAADFDRTLAERRERADAEFAQQLGDRQEQLRVADENVRAAENEALRIVADAQSQAEAVREQGFRDAEQVVAAAREEAERVRLEGERELAAIVERRDAITAQLANVRQVLSTIGGGSLGAFADEEESISEQDVVETAVQPVEADDIAETKVMAAVEN